MIIENVKVKITNKIKKNLLKDNINSNVGDIMYIDSKYLTPSSTIKVKAKCFFCSNIKELKYQTYLGNIKNTGLFACSHKCSIEKYEITCLKKYGYNNVSKSPDIKEKIKQTNIEKYGHSSSLCNSEIKEKSKSTLLEKYNVDNASKSPDIKEKIKQTNIKKYGYDSASKSPDIKEKIKQTNIEKYGHSSSLCNSEIKEKSKNTMIIKYGSVNYMSSNIGKLHLKNIFQENIIKKINENNYTLINIEEYNINLKHISCNNDFSISKRLLSERIRNNNELCLVCNKLQCFSDAENKILDFIKSININCIQKNRNILSNGKEIDIYCPDNKIAIEYNGMYWHSSLFK